VLGFRDTGEHISDDKGVLQYIPFPVCEETGKPLELHYGVEKGTMSAFPRALCTFGPLHCMRQLEEMLT
jgi:hypothetical protein